MNYWRESCGFTGFNLHQVTLSRDVGPAFPGNHPSSSRLPGLANEIYTVTMVTVYYIAVGGDISVEGRLVIIMWYIWNIGRPNFACNFVFCSSQLRFTPLAASILLLIIVFVFFVFCLFCWFEIFWRIFDVRLTEKFSCRDAVHFILYFYVLSFCLAITSSVARATRTRLFISIATRWTVSVTCPRYYG